MESPQPDVVGNAQGPPAGQNATSSLTRARTLAALYDRHAASVFGLALRMLGDESAAEEVVEEVFVYALDHLTELDDRQTGRDASAWLLRITHRLCLERLGRRRPARPPQPELPAGLGVGDEDRTHRVREALASLPETERQVIELMFFEGLPREDIAMRLACAQSEVLHLARLGLEKLREALYPTTDD